jgi:hypothetical protein
MLLELTKAQSREQRSPCSCAIRWSTSRERNEIASVREVAMFFAISDFTAVKWAALCAARVAVGAVVDSSGGGIWGVSDPLCHPPITVPGQVFGGRSRPRCMSPSSGRTALCP